jgi:hypothetical protein
MHRLGSEADDSNLMELELDTFFDKESDEEFGAHENQALIASSRVYSMNE